MLISLFRHTDEQYPTRRVGEHADIQKELAPASIMVLIQSALVFELQMFFKAGFNQPASISVVNVPERPSFPQHAVIVKSLPNVSKSLGTSEAASELSPAPLLARSVRIGPSDKRSDTRVDTLRKTYGDDFLSDFRGDACLGTVLDETGADSPTELVKEHCRRK
jgi:hypothetical protein